MLAESLAGFADLAVVVSTLDSGGLGAGVPASAARFANTEHTIVNQSKSFSASALHFALPLNTDPIMKSGSNIRLAAIKSSALIISATSSAPDIAI